MNYTYQNLKDWLDELSEDQLKKKVKLEDVGRDGTIYFCYGTLLDQNDEKEPYLLFDGRTKEAK